MPPGDSLRNPGDSDADRTKAAIGDGRPAWLDTDRYPFDPHWHDADPGRVHYVDEGEGDHAVVAVHGNPTWSFMYRRLIRRLAPDYRVVVPDLLGFGLSEAPAPSAFSYRPRDHARVVGRLIDGLDAEAVTLVVHDWGGPIGLAYALANPERVRSLVVSNTVCWPIETRFTRLFGRLMGGPLGRVACERYNAFARGIVPIAVADRSRLSPATHAHYVEPLARKPHRRGTWVFPRDLLAAGDWLGRLDARLDRLADVPTLLAWGLEDAVFGPPARSRFDDVFEHASTEAFGGVGHYVPEEAGQAYADRVRAFLDRH